MTKLCSSMTVAVIAFASLAGCTYQGGDIGDPVTRKFHWFSFVAGDDIRSTCTAGTPDRARLVYNGIYHDQLRIYEVDSLRRVVTAKVTGAGDLAEFDPQDLAAPWRAKESHTQLDEAGYARLVASFAESGLFEPPPVGLELPSRSYFWTAALCRAGQYSFTAFKHPSPAFDRLTFPAALFALDNTGVAVNQPKALTLDPQWEDMVRRNQVTHFTLKVGQDGMVR